MANRWKWEIHMEPRAIDWAVFVFNAEHFCYVRHQQWKWTEACFEWTPKQTWAAIRQVIAHMEPLPRFTFFSSQRWRRWSIAVAVCKFQFSSSPIFFLPWHLWWLAFAHPIFFSVNLFTLKKKKNCFVLFSLAADDRNPFTAHSLFNCVELLPPFYNF